MRTNQRGIDNDGSQAERISCSGWHFGHELSILGKEIDDERKNGDGKTWKNSTKRVSSLFLSLIAEARFIFPSPNHVLFYYWITWTNDFTYKHTGQSSERNHAVDSVIWGYSYHCFMLTLRHFLLLCTVTNVLIQGQPTYWAKDKASCLRLSAGNDEVTFRKWDKENDFQSCVSGGSSLGC